MDELAELGVHVNNEGGCPVFSLGVKETAYDPSALVAGATFLFALSRKLAITRSVYLNPTPPPGPRKRGEDGGYPLARQSGMKSTTPCRCHLPMDSSICMDNAWTCGGYVHH
jgi:hypothetical protein